MRKILLGMFRLFGEKFGPFKTAFANKSTTKSNSDVLSHFGPACIAVGGSLLGFCSLSLSQESIEPTDHE